MVLEQYFKIPIKAMIHIFGDIWFIIQNETLQFARLVVFLSFPLLVILYVTMYS